MAKRVEIIVGQVYQHRKNPKRVGTVIHATEYPDAISLKLNNSEQPVTVTRDALSKSWKRVADAEAQPTEQAEEVAQEVVEEAQPTAAELDVTKYEKPKKKQATKKEAGEKAEKPKKERKPKTDPAIIQSLLEYVFATTKELGGDCAVPREEDMKFRALRKDGKQFCKLMWSGKSIKLFSRVETNYPFKTINYALPNQYDFTTFDDAAKKAIKELLKKSYDDCGGFKKSKKKKEEK